VAMSSVDMMKSSFFPRSVREENIQKLQAQDSPLHGFS
jgi:hypothetical protein